MGAGRCRSAIRGRCPRQLLADRDRRQGERSPTRADPRGDAARRARSRGRGDHARRPALEGNRAGLLERGHRRGPDGPLRLPGDPEAAGGARGRGVQDRDRRARQADRQAGPIRHRARRNEPDRVQAGRLGDRRARRHDRGEPGRLSPQPDPGLHGQARARATTTSWRSRASRLRPAARTRRRCREMRDLAYEMRELLGAGDIESIGRRPAPQLGAEAEPRPRDLDRRDRRALRPGP